MEDSINLVCDVDGIGPGVYRLVGDTAGMMGWYSQRTKSVESQLETMKSVTSTIARGADKRTVEGRKARRINEGVSGILRDLEWIEEMTT